jgi:acyl carrier protein
MGLASLSPSDGRASLERIFDGARAQLSVMPFDVREWCGKASTFASTTLFPVLLAEAPSAPEAEAKAAPEPSVRERVEALPGGAARRAAMEAYLQSAVARVLRMSPASIDLDKPVRSMGLDSLMAIELRNRLEAATGTAIPTTLIWNYPTVRRLAPEVAARMNLELEPPAKAAVAAAVADLPMSEDLETLLGELEALTNDEAAGILGGPTVRGRASDV